MRYIITEEQLQILIENKRVSKVANQIIEDIERSRKNLNEATLLQESVIDVVKKYLKKGLLTTAVISTLLSSGNITAQDLVSAGVPQDKIPQTSVNSETLSDEAVEKELINVLNNRGQKNEIRKLQKLSPEGKATLIAHIKSQVKDLSDLDKYTYYITNWMKDIADREGTTKIDKNVQEVNLELMPTDSLFNFGDQFKMNSVELRNPEKIQKVIQDALKFYDEVYEITIVSSSSTLRNKGHMKNVTWEESSRLRGQGVKTLIVNNMTYGVEEEKSITDEMVKISYKGSNGDGTSGPPTKYETDPKYVENYKAQGIDSKYWDSKGQGDAYEDDADYQQHQYVKINIFGSVIKDGGTCTKIDYKYLQMNVKKNGGKLSPTPKKRENKIPKRKKTHSRIECKIK